MAAMFLGRRQITPTERERGPPFGDYATTPWIGGNQVIMNGDSSSITPSDESPGTPPWRAGRKGVTSSEERHLVYKSDQGQGTHPWRGGRKVTTHDLATTEERYMTSVTGKSQMTTSARGSQVISPRREEKHMTTARSQIMTSPRESHLVSSRRNETHVTTTTEQRNMTTVAGKSLVMSPRQNQIVSPRRAESNVTSTTEESTVIEKRQMKSQGRPPWLSGGKVNTTTEDSNVAVKTGYRRVIAPTGENKVTPPWRAGKQSTTAAEERNVTVTSQRKYESMSTGENKVAAPWREGRQMYRKTEETNVTTSTEETHTASTWKSQGAPVPAERRKVNTTASEQNVTTTVEEQKVLTEIQNTRVDFHRLASPHLAKSEVLKMLTEQEQSHHGYHHEHHGHHVQHVDWPPPEHEHPASFFTAIETDEVKKVAWPPVEPADAEQPLREYQAVHSVQRHKNSPPPPSTMSLRQEIPLRQPPQEVYQSTPTAKKNPSRWRGDLKWPPEYCREVPEEEQPKKEIVKPKRQRKDYTSFFAAHELPNNYPGYRIPPGTQYYGSSHQPGHSDM